MQGTSVISKAGTVGLI